MSYFARKKQRELDDQQAVWQSPQAMVPEPPPSYFDAGELQIQAEDISTSDINAEERFYGDRNDTLAEMIASGEVPEELVAEHTNVVGYDSDLNEEYTGLDYNGLAAAMNENGYDFEASDERMIETMASERYANEELYKRGDAWDKAMWFGGGMWATAKDPIILASMLIPVGGQYKAGSSFLRNMARFTGIHAAVGAGVELPLQKEIFDFKQRIDSEYGVGDVMMNVGFAAFASGIIGGPLETIAARRLNALDGGVKGTMFDGAPDDMTVGEAAGLVNQADDIIDGKPVTAATTPSTDIGTTADEIVMSGWEDASDIFGEGAEVVRYEHKQTGSFIEVIKKPDGSSSVKDLGVPEEHRGGGIGKALQASAIRDSDLLTGQIHSRAAAKTAYDLGRRPYDMPDATLEEVFSIMDEMSSVNLIIDNTDKKFAIPEPAPKPSQGNNIRDNIGFNTVEPDDIPDTEIIMREDGVEVPYAQIKEQAAIEVEAKQNRVKRLMECLKRG